MPSVVKFQDPPANPRGGHHATHHDAIAAALRERPGEWALVLEGVSATLAFRIKRGISPSYEPPGAFEATARRRTDGKSDIYARYVGE